MKYLLYARKSTEDEDRQVMSIEAQLEELKQYALKEKLKISETFIESKSAKTPGRPVFNQMIDKIKSAKEPLGLLVWHPDRLARNSVDGGQIIYLIDTGKILSLKSPTFWFEPTPQGLFMLQVAFGQSKYYSDNLSENIKRGNRQKLRRGEWSFVAPIGYINNRKTRNIEPDSVKARIIKKVFKEYATGNHSLESMAVRLSFWGILSKNGKVLGIHAVKRILTNPVYIGLIVVKGETYQGSFKPIIDKATFDKVQQILKDRSRPRRKIGGHNFPFLGLLKCGECGAAITAQYSKGNGGTYVYYRCTQKLGPCSQKYIRDDLLLEQLRSNIRKVALREDWKNKMLKQLDKTESKYRQSSQLYAERLEQQIKDTEDKLDKLVESFLEGIIEKPVYLKMKDELIRTKTELLEKKKSFRRKGDFRLQPLRDWIIEASSVDKIASSKNMEEIKLFFEKIGSNRRLLDRELVFEWKEPWNILTFSEDTLRNLAGDRVRSTPKKFSKNVENSVWWRRRESNPRPEIARQSIYRLSSVLFSSAASRNGF